MAAINVQNVTVQFGTQVVLDEASFEVGPDERLGFIGPNGTGKTTIFRLIAGELEPDLGVVTTAKSARIGYLKQEPEIGLSRTLHDEVGSVFDDLLQMEKRMHELSEEMAKLHDDPKLPELMVQYEKVNARFLAAGGYNFETRLNEILHGLGFSQADYELLMSALSGGQKCRAALAKLLLQDKPMLLLDEPTNHLDIDAVRWLEKFLCEHQGGAVIISHDRYLLDRLAQRIIELERRKIYSFPGNYSNYAQVKELRLLTEQREFEKDQAFLKKEREFIAKHMAGQRTKEAQGRRTRLERRLREGEFVTETSAKAKRTKLNFEQSTASAKRSGQVALRCDELAKRYDKKQLFADLMIQVSVGERFGITGPNGTGKSTLLKIIMNQVAQDAGTVELNPALHIGYYDQEHSELDEGRTVIEEIRSASKGMSEASARSLLAQYLFHGDDVFKEVRKLSGGEQSRVRLAKLILQEPDMLILDEPTNHLDIPSREVLEDALLGYTGTILVISHDRYFLDRIVDRLLVIRREGHQVYNGNYSFYIEQIEREQANKKEPAKKKQIKRTDKENKPKRKSSIFDRYGVDELEAMIIDHEEQLGLLHEKFGDPEINKDPEALEELKEKVEALERELAEIDEAWQERAEMDSL